MIRRASGIADQYDKPEVKTALDALAAPSANPRQRASRTSRAEKQTTRLDIAKGLILKDQARLLRELEKQHKVRLYLVSNAARLLAEVDRPTTCEPAVKSWCGRSSPRAANRGWAMESARCLTELRGAPPSAIVLL